MISIPRRHYGVDNLAYIRRDELPPFFENNIPGDIRDLLNIYYNQKTWKILLYFKYEEMRGNILNNSGSYRKVFPISYIQHMRQPLALARLIIRDTDTDIISLTPLGRALANNVLKLLDNRLARANLPTMTEQMINKRNNLKITEEELKELAEEHMKEKEEIEQEAMRARLYEKGDTK